MQDAYEAARIRALSLNRGMMSGVPFGESGNGDGAGVFGYGRGRHRIGSYATLARFAVS